MKHTRRPQTGRMVRITLNFGRVSLMTLHQQAGSKTAYGHGRGKIEGLSRDQLFGLVDVGNNLFDWLTSAGRQPRQRKRRTHELQESPSIKRLHFGRTSGKFVMMSLSEVVPACQFIQA